MRTAIFIGTTSPQRHELLRDTSFKRHKHPSEQQSEPLLGFGGHSFSADPRKKGMKEKWDTSSLNVREGKWDCHLARCKRSG
jgi:hypothetical protein